ncbi:hypothetical protein GF386_02995 [Candidatus Pacearchaeota archaeon]|nr:hypothetical protein [Candidatus Pacearchaeota archaeon]MBD3283106.1 hypothetical protein [Candidatus Pacearchaeota archaeon]
MSRNKGLSRKQKKRIDKIVSRRMHRTSGQQPKARPATDSRFMRFGLPTSNRNYGKRHIDFYKPVNGVYFFMEPEKSPEERLHEITGLMKSRKIVIRHADECFEINEIGKSRVRVNYSGEITYSGDIPDYVSDVSVFVQEILSQGNDPNHGFLENLVQLGYRVSERFRLSVNFDERLALDERERRGFLSRYTGYVSLEDALEIAPQISDAARKSRQRHQPQHVLVNLSQLYDDQTESFIYIGSFGGARWPRLKTHPSEVLRNWREFPITTPNRFGKTQNSDEIMDYQPAF